MDPFASATAQLEALRSGEVSETELLDAQLARVEKVNDDLNAIVLMDLDQARRAARAIDGGPTNAQPLLGLPMTVKEAFNLAGAPTTWGLPEPQGQRPDGGLGRRHTPAGSGRNRVRQDKTCR